MQHKDELQVITKIEVNHLRLVSKVDRGTDIHQPKVVLKGTITVEVTRVEATCMEASKTRCKVECHLRLHLTTTEIQCQDMVCHLISMDHQASQASQ